MQLLMLAFLINAVLLDTRIYLEAQNFSEDSNYLLNSIYKKALKLLISGNYVKSARKGLLYK